MGIRVEPIPDPYGDDCLHCYEADETPQILYAIFKDIGRGTWWDLADPSPPSPPNRVFQLFQDDVNPCLWTYQGDDWFIEYRAHNPGGAPHSSLRASTIIDFIQVFAFTQAYDPTCIHQFDNFIVAPEDVFYFGGAAWIFRLTI